MRKLVLATIVTVATAAPALAQTNADNFARQSASWARFERTVAAPRQNTMSCDGPYIGGWKHGYPGSERSC
jgi:hypothetical protein